MPPWLARRFGLFTPLGWLIALIAVVIAIAMLASAWDRMWAWLPWSSESRLDRAEAHAATAEDQALASGLQAEGEGEQVRRVDTYAHQIITIQTAAAESVAEARSAPDAETPLDTDRAVRLRHHDDELCRVSPDLVGCAVAAPDAAADR